MKTSAFVIGGISGVVGLAVTRAVLRGRRGPAAEEEVHGDSLTAITGESLRRGTTARGRGEEGLDRGHLAGARRARDEDVVAPIGHAQAKLERGGGPGLPHNRGGGVQLGRRFEGEPRGIAGRAKRLGGELSRHSFLLGASIPFTVVRFDQTLLEWRRELAELFLNCRQMRRGEQRFRECSGPCLEPSGRVLARAVWFF